jgi:hypothetical protein
MDYLENHRYFGAANLQNQSLFQTAVAEGKRLMSNEAEWP